MKSRMTHFVWIFALLAPSVADHPIQNVMDLLSKLQAKAVTDAKSQELIHQKQVYTFNTRSKQIAKDLKQASRQQEESSSRITATEAQLEGLKRSVDRLQTEVNGMKDKAREQKKTRDEKMAAYEKTMKDLKATEKGIHTAIEGVANAGTAFFQTNLRRGVPHAVGATDHTHEVEELGHKLEEDVQHQETEVTEDYTENVQNNIELALAALKDEVQAAEDTIKSKVSAIKTAEDNLADAKSQLSEAENQLKLSKKEKTDLAGESEIEADDDRRAMDSYKNIETSLGMAVSALEKSSGVSHTVPVNADAPAVPDFLQLSSAPKDGKMRAVELLRREAKISNSKALAHLADRLAATTKGPMDQIRNLIQKMVHRLADEQQDEDKHKAWCDHELEETNVTRDELSNKVSQKEAEIEKLESKIKMLTDALDDADNKLAENAEFIKEASQIRKEGSEENAICIKDSVQAQASLEQADKALQTFYSEVSEDAARPVKDVMTSTMEDFSKNEAECKSNEETARIKFEEDKKESQIQVATLRKRSELKTEQKTQSTKSLQSAEGSKEKLQGQLATTEQYFTDLQPSCVDGDSTYEERKAARDDEIAALNQADDILKGQR